MFQNFLLRIVVLLLLAPFHSAADDGSEKVLVLVHSGEMQTQGMAMVLSDAMHAQGAEVSILLCGSAGDMAVKGYQGKSLKPFNASPGDRLQGLINNGVRVELCALYLPNSGLSADDIIDGVNPRAQPPEIARLMRAKEVRVFSF